jgi:hypothetical protein
LFKTGTAALLIHDSIHLLFHKHMIMAMEDDCSMILMKYLMNRLTPARTIVIKTVCWFKNANYACSRYIYLPFIV